MEQLSIVEKDGANYHLYELEGALNAYTIGEFQNTLYEAVHKNNIVLDMSKLVELDPAGIGFLMAAFNDSEDVGNKLYFMSMSNEAEKAIAATGFKYLFNLINSVTEVNQPAFFLQKQFIFPQNSTKIVSLTLYFS